MKDNQHEQLFTELTSEIEATPVFKELDDEVAASCSGGVAYTGSDDPDVTLFDKEGRTGNSLRVNASIGDGLTNLANPYNYQKLPFNDKTSSFTINRGRWAFYADDKYTTRLFTYGPGTYDVAARNNNRVTSLKRIG